MFKNTIKILSTGITEKITEITIPNIIFMFCPSFRYVLKRLINIGIQLIAHAVKEIKYTNNIHLIVIALKIFF